MPLYPTSRWITVCNRFGHMTTLCHTFNRNPWSTFGRITMGIHISISRLYLSNHCHRLHIYVVVESQCLRAGLCQVAGLFVQSQCGHDCDYLQECGHFVTPLHCWGISDTTQDQHHLLTSTLHLLIPARL